MMLRFAKHLLSLTLVVLLSVGGALRASAVEGQGGLSAVVICSGDGETTIWLDQSGTPANPCATDPCSLCILTSFAVLPAPHIVPMPPTGVRKLDPHLFAVSVASASNVAANARAPPAAKVIA